MDELELEGLAYMKFESAKMLGMAELHKIYAGQNFDPVLHQTKVERGGITPPCGNDPKQCQYRKSIQSEFYSTPRRTAFRTEVICPADRCGWLLKPHRIGGQFDDYGYCIK